MLRNLSAQKTLYLIIGLVILLLAARGATELPKLITAEFSNPDSYTKLVLVRDWTPEAGYQHMARDGAPDGSYLHWSVVHTWTMQQLAYGLASMGMPWERALLLAGGGLTAISLLLVYLAVAGAVLSLGGRLAALGAALVLATSTGIKGYGQWTQITHHIFMLVPLAIAAWLSLRTLATSQPQAARPHSTLRHSPSHASLGLFVAGLCMGLSLWISPETMPIITALLALPASNRLQFTKSAPATWPLAAGLFLIVFIAWQVDPPPPTFDAWALDHISLAWLSWAAIIGALICLCDILAHTNQRSLGLRLTMAAIASLIGLGLWVALTPGAMAGPSGLLPAELKTLWWATIKELRPVSSPGDFLSWLLMPLLAGSLLLLAARKHRCLWWAILALSCLIYAALSASHIRMGAATGLLCALAWGVWLTTNPLFCSAQPTNAPNKQQYLAASLLLLPVIVFLAALTTLIIEKKHANTQENPQKQCFLQDIANELNNLPQGTILVGLNDAPKVLWFTHHKVVAGNYHHNTQGILDVLLAWRSQPDNEQAIEITKRRKINYLLVCAAADLNGQRLQQRLTRGDTPAWLEEPTRMGSWLLYRPKQRSSAVLP